MAFAVPSMYDAMLYAGMPPRIRAQVETSAAAATCSSIRTNIAFTQWLKGYLKFKSNRMHLYICFLYAIECSIQYKMANHNVQQLQKHE